jgi:hypothetical protein
MEKESGWSVFKDLIWICIAYGTMIWSAFFANTDQLTELALVLGIAWAMDYNILRPIRERVRSRR